MNRTAPFLFACLLLSAPSAEAEIIVNIAKLDIQAGSSTGTLDVMISSDGAPVQLGSFGFEFLITRANGTPTELDFTASQPQPFGDSRYVFYQQSLFDPGPLGNVTTTSTNDDTYTGGDQTTNANGYVTVTGPVLLTQLQFTLDTSLRPVVGDVFNVSLIPGAGAAGQTTSPTYFQDPSGDYLVYSSNIAPVTIVPEPSSLISWTVGLLSAASIFRRLRPPTARPATDCHPVRSIVLTAQI